LWNDPLLFTAPNRLSYSLISLPKWTFGRVLVKKPDDKDLMTNAFWRGTIIPAKSQGRGVVGLYVKV
jgi:hypothetical protein